jgi:opacity protein-like surface antigen
MRRSGLALGGFCAVSAAISSSASLAQDGGVLLTFGIENRLEIVRNDDLAVPATGTDVTNATRLSFGLRSETAIDRLDFSASGALLAENNSGVSGTQFDFGRAALTLAYHREVPASVLDVDAAYRNDNIDAFVDDLGDVDEDGTRTDTAVSARLETGRTSSIGFALGAAYESTEYQDASDPELDDSTETRADLAVIFHASETVTGRVGLRYRLFEEENPGTRTVETLIGYAGLEYAISERLDLLAELGYVEAEDEDFDIIERARGPEVSIGLTYAMPAGTAVALLRVTTEVDEGQRETFEIGRDLETPTSAISARLGVTHADTTGTDLIGSLRWDRPLPDGGIGLNIERRVGFDTDDDEPVTTSLISIDWSKEVNEVSSIALDLTYEQSDSPSEKIEQVTFGAGYNYRLTEDWSLNSGVGYRVRHDADGRSESPNLFVSLSREFELRP